MQHDQSNPIDLPEYLGAETALEQQLLREPDFVRGLYWGVPRFGHPEGAVYRHVREVSDNIDRLELDPDVRRQLRLVALVHDTFKYAEDKGTPRDWSRHHGVLARRFLERYTQEEAVLDVVELHDEPYYSWRHIHLQKKPELGLARLRRLHNRIGDHLRLLYLFFKCDTLTGDKVLAPLSWYEQRLPPAYLVDLCPTSRTAVPPIHRNQRT